MMGYRFLRQRPIGSYIVNFFCPELKLVIEIDGITHTGRLKKYLQRQEYLENMGLHVLRFDDRSIRRDINGAIYAIEGWIINKTNGKKF